MWVTTSPLAVSPSPNFHDQPTATLSSGRLETTEPEASKLSSVPARAVLGVLEHRSVSIPEPVRRRVFTSRDEHQLQRWFDRAFAAATAEETAYIKAIRQQHYPWLSDTMVPVSGEIFTRYGVSTTPTLVFINRDGTVKLYHPGQMTKAELEPVITAIVAPMGSAR